MTKRELAEFRKIKAEAKKYDYFVSVHQFNGKFQLTDESGHIVLEDRILEDFIGEAKTIINEKFSLENLQKIAAKFNLVILEDESGYYIADNLEDEEESESVSIISEKLDDLKEVKAWLDNFGSDTDEVSKPF